MLEVVVIKSASYCVNCTDAERIVNELAEKYPDIKPVIMVTGTPESMKYGIVTTPVVVLGKKIYSMGKPVIKAKVEGWIKKELKLLQEKN
ncbi:MAG: thioredoxin family protein [Candidatus Riflebacteria bacterium]|nr:thioredoxin family protein [Candidatus Riflebacteria bacterium]